MKRTLNLFLLGLLTAGITAGCDTKEEVTTTETAAQTAAQLPVVRTRDHRRASSARSVENVIK